MRWPTERAVPGQVREVVRFAWIPVELESGETAWLERYIAREMWHRDEHWWTWKVIGFLPFEGGTK